MPGPTASLSLLLAVAQVAMLVLEQTFTRCEAGGTVSIWQVPMTRRDILRETAMLLVQPVPTCDGLIVLHTG